MQLDFISFPVELRENEQLKSYKPHYGEEGIVLRVNTTTRTIVRFYDYQSNDYFQDMKMLDQIINDQPNKKERCDYHYL